IHRAKQLYNVLALGRDLKRLAADPHVLGEVLAWQSLQPGHLAAQTLELGVEAPQQAWDPGRAAFDEDQAQLRIFLEHPVGDKAHDVRLDCLRPERVRFEIGVDAAAARARWVRPSAGAT